MEKTLEAKALNWRSYSNLTLKYRLMNSSTGGTKPGGVSGEQQAIEFGGNECMCVCVCVRHQGPGTRDQVWGSWMTGDIIPSKERMVLGLDYLGDSQRMYREQK